MRVFSSESALIDFVRSEDYDRGSGTPFVAEKNGGSAIDGGGVTAEEGLSGRQSGQADRGEAGQDKVGMAVIINEAPMEGEVPRWDYTLRLNYTYGISQFGEQVNHHSQRLVDFSRLAYDGCKLFLPQGNEWRDASPFRPNFFLVCMMIFIDAPSLPTHAHVCRRCKQLQRVLLEMEVSCYID